MSGIQVLSEHSRRGKPYKAAELGTLHLRSPRTQLKTDEGLSNMWVTEGGPQTLKIRLDSCLEVRGS
jgi:hypothetical protein